MNEEGDFEDSFAQYNFEFMWLGMNKSCSHLVCYTLWLENIVAFDVANYFDISWIPTSNHINEYQSKKTKLFTLTLPSNLLP